jgi:hypothetical protein
MFHARLAPYSLALARALLSGPLADTLARCTR